jgi:sugar phosphate isomerase/epimerase
VIPRSKVYLCDLGDTGETLALAAERGLNIEVQAFAFPGSSALSSEVEDYRLRLAGFPGRVSMHGAYYDLNPLSADPKLAELSRERYTQSLAVARKLRAHAVIFHSTFSPLVRSTGYLEGWVARNAGFWADFLRDAEQADQTLLIENLYEDRPEILLALAQRIAHPRLRICLDVGHVNLYSRAPLVRWAETLAPYLACVHLNDNNGETDEHMAPGEGAVDYEGLFRYLHACDDPPILSLEVESDEHFARSLEFLAGHGVEVGRPAVPSAR